MADKKYVPTEWEMRAFRKQFQKENPDLPVIRYVERIPDSELRESQETNHNSNPQEKS